jgi:hypothetical protein
MLLTNNLSRYPPATMLRQLVGLNKLRGRRIGATSRPYLAGLGNRIDLSEVRLKLLLEHLKIIYPWRLEFPNGSIRACVNFSS